MKPNGDRATGPGLHRPGTLYSAAGPQDQASSGAPGQSPGGDCGGPRHGGGLKNVSQNLRTSNGNRVTGPGLTSRGHPIRIPAPKIKLALAPRDSLPVATAAGLVKVAATSCRQRFQDQAHTGGSETVSTTPTAVQPRHWNDSKLAAKRPPGPGPDPRGRGPRTRDWPSSPGPLGRQEQP